MNKNGPIIIIEDDLDDQFIFQTIFEQLGYPNKVEYFTNGFDAIEFLRNMESKPFLVISDINMPIIDGFSVRQKIFSDEELRKKCIPYLFLTTGASPDTIEEAYSLSVQGFFQKPNSIEGIKSTLKRIVDYWQECLSPLMPQPLS